DEMQARSHQEAWARHLGVDLEITNCVGMKLRLIPPGQFTMGTSEEQVEALVRRMTEEGATDTAVRTTRDEAPARIGRVDGPYYGGVGEVTMAQFGAFVTEPRYRTDGERSGDGGFSHSPAGGWVRRPEHIWKTPGPWTPAADDPVVHVSWNDAQAFCAWL